MSTRKYRLRATLRRFRGSAPASGVPPIEAVAREIGDTATQGRSESKRLPAKLAERAELSRLVLAIRISLPEDRGGAESQDSAPGDVRKRPARAQKVSRSKKGGTFLRHGKQLKASKSREQGGSTAAKDGVAPGANNKAKEPTGSKGASSGKKQGRHATMGAKPVGGKRPRPGQK